MAADDAESLPSTRLLSAGEVEHRYGFTVVRLREWRARGGGPAWHKIGRSVFYRVDELDAFVAKRVVHPAPIKASGEHAAGRDVDPVSLAIIRALHPLAKEIEEAIDSPAPEWSNLSDAGKVLDLLRSLAERVFIMSDAIEEGLGA